VHLLVLIIGGLLNHVYSRGWNFVFCSLSGCNSTHVLLNSISVTPFCISFFFFCVRFSTPEVGSLLVCNYMSLGGPLMVAQWLRYCATNRKVAGSIPDSVTGIFHWHNPSDRTMALGSTQLLTEWVPGAFPGGKVGRCVGLINLPPSCAVVM
jgi:hypothetical protein